ncbi:hypothetical protein ZHAS_00010977 [Anopheles sinensis]|uniref:Uncharacterized protein n=1 Tax=Anopheles sinensis TaxID=74873 RepID=A0A084VZ06_ANOSI|nr:hypothetical protein ZHAS_00010977 [Anopheles sinensis]
MEKVLIVTLLKSLPNLDESASADGGVESATSSEKLVATEAPGKRPDGGIIGCTFGARFLANAGPNSVPTSRWAINKWFLSRQSTVTTAAAATNNNWASGWQPGGWASCFISSQRGQQPAQTSLTRCLSYDGVSRRKQNQPGAEGSEPVPGIGPPGVWLSRP